MIDIMTISEKDMTDQTLQYLYRLCYPMVPHGIPTTVFHNAIKIITDLQTERDALKKQVKTLSSLVIHNEKAKCDHEYLPDEDGTVYHCGDYEVASYKDGFFLCSKHAED